MRFQCRCQISLADPSGAVIAGDWGCSFALQFLSFSMLLRQVQHSPWAWLAPRQALWHVTLTAACMPGTAACRASLPLLHRDHQLRGLQFAGQWLRVSCATPVMAPALGLVGVGISSALAGQASIYCRSATDYMMHSSLGLSTPCAPLPAMSPCTPGHT